jgi:hypothetical protein
MARRAPRLAADEYIARHVTRRGRFAARDPLVGRPLPTFLQIVGAVGWAALTGYAFRKAYTAEQGGGVGLTGGIDEDGGHR